MRLNLAICVACATLAAMGGTSAAQPGSASLTNSAYLTTANTATLNPQQFTIEARFRPDGVGYGGNDTWGVCIVSKPRQSSAGSHLESWGLYWSPVTQRIAFDVTHVFGTTGEAAYSSSTIAVGQSAHVAATFDGAALRLYVNGVLESTVASSSSVVYYGATEPVLLGASNFDFSSFARRFQGLIDDVRIWDHARTSAEIVAGASCGFAGPRTGLLAEWGFTNTQTNDVSGHARDASFVGVPAFATNICDLSTERSAQLVNSNYLTTANTASLNLQTLSVEAWIRPDGPGYGNSSNGAIIAAKPKQNETGTGAEGSWELGWTPSANKVYFGIGHSLHGLYESVLSTSTVVPGQTVHAAATFDGLVLRLYVNGVLDASTTVSSSAVYFGPADPILLGAGNYGAGYTRRFQGLIDDVRLWDHARTASEISSNLACHLSGTQSGLLANWTFDSYSMVDVSGHGRDATFVGLAGFGTNLGGSSLTIVSQPAFTAVCQGSSGTLSVVASGSGLSYQWQFYSPSAAAWSDVVDGSNGAAIIDEYFTASGSMTASLTVGESVFTLPDHLFRCRVSNACGSVYSDLAAFRVAAVPTPQAPPSVSVCAGASASLTAFTLGGQYATVQWFHGITPIQGGTLPSGAVVTINTPSATQSTLTIANVQLSEAGSYHVVVTNACSSIAGGDGTLTVNACACLIADVTGIGGPPTAPDGLLTGDDFNAFISAFAAGDLLADVTGIGGPPAGPDGLITGDDFNAFISAFATGCP